MSYRPVDRAGRTRLLALCWIGFLMVFFTFSTTQEYYSMPMYPALALLLGCVMAAADANRSRQDQRDDRQHVISRWVKAGTIGLAAVATIAATIIFAILYSVHRISTTGDISRALLQHPGAYTLSLGHLGDLTLQSFAYLRAPLALAGLACIVGAAGAWLLPGRRAFVALAAMMVLFFHASRMALVVFDPYLSSRPLAEALRRAPKGQLIVDGAYYEFSSVSFYSDRTAFLLNGRINNLEYGSYAPGSPPVFIGDKEFAQLWSSPAVCYMVADGHRQAALSRLVGPENLHQVAESGGKSLFTNHISGVQSASEGTESLRTLW